MGFEQSVAWWCFEREDIDAPDLLDTVKAVGYSGVELVPVDKFQMVRDAGLKIVADRLFAKIEQGISNIRYWDTIKRQAEKNLKLAQQWDIPNLIVFSGNRAGVDDETGTENAIKLLEQLAADAESADVTLVLELLNSKVDHPDYMADHTDWGVKVVSAVNSPKVRLLYDIYHMQVMEGNVIQTIRDNHQWFAHYHTAGVPGRHEIDETQELNYRPICQAIAAAGYSGYVGQEFIPTGDWKAALRQAYDVCNINGLT